MTDESVVEETALISSEEGAVPEGETEKLSLKQANFIATLKESKSLEEAYRATGLNPKTHYRWKKTSQAYQLALSTLADEVVDLARHQMDLSVAKAAEMIDRALDSSETTDCPHCKQELVCLNCEAPVTLQNWNATLKAADMLLRRRGEFVKRIEVTGKIKHEHDAFTHEERIAQALYAAGHEIPPAIESALRSRNALPERRGDVSTSDEVVEVEEEEEVEGEVREVNPTPSAQQESPEPSLP